jgi:hypothetical protein
MTDVYRLIPALSAALQGAAAPAGAAVPVRGSLLAPEARRATGATRNAQTAVTAERSVLAMTGPGLGDRITA